MPKTGCKGCPRHTLECRATCAKWAAHEAEKDERYKLNAARAQENFDNTDSIKRHQRSEGRRGKMREK